jgi:hypothetical protein
MRNIPRRPRGPRSSEQERRTLADLSNTDRRARSATAAGGVGRTDRIRDVHGSARLLPTDFVVRQLDTSADSVLQLPNARTLLNRRMRIEDASGGAAAHNITVRALGPQTIDGAAAAAITTDFGSLTVRSDGRNWFTE